MAERRSDAEPKRDFAEFRSAPLTVVEDESVRWIRDGWSDRSDLWHTAARVTVLGFPFDHCVSHRPGTRFGPSRILDLLNGYSRYCTDRRADLTAVRLVNGGTVPMINNIARYNEQVRHAVAALDPGEILLGLGGDHSVSDPIYRGQADRSEEPVGLIMVDAHFNSRPPVPEREHSGHWVYTLRDVLDYRATAQLGINASIYAPHYMQQAEESGILVRTLSETRRQSTESLIHEAIEHVLNHAGRFHLSIDIDAIDAAFCPGTSVPNPCGLYPQEVADIAFFAAQHEAFLGCDIMEVKSASG